MSPLPILRAARGNFRKALGYRFTCAHNWIMLSFSLFAFAVMFWNFAKLNATDARNSYQDNQNLREKDTIVVYSGPTVFTKQSLNPSTGLPREALYLANFDYFLENGICGSPATSDHDTVLVITAPIMARYAKRLSDLQEVCRQRYGQAVYILEREDRCYDMESVRIVLQQQGSEPLGSTLASVDLSRYEYFVYVNCGMAGPYLPKHQKVPWTRNFTSLLSDSVKMAGLSINFVRKGTHVQSFTYALDRIGLAIINTSGAVYDCGDGPLGRNEYNEIIERYEIGMSQAVMRAGYEIASLMPRFTVSNGTAHPEMPYSCRRDFWFEYKMRDCFNQIPRWEDFIFFKVSRFIPVDIRDVYAARSRADFGPHVFQPVLVPLVAAVGMISFIIWGHSSSFNGIFQRFLFRS